MSMLLRAMYSSVRLCLVLALALIGAPAAMARDQVSTASELSPGVRIIGSELVKKCALKVFPIDPKTGEWKGVKKGEPPKPTVEQNVAFYKCMREGGYLADVEKKALDEVGMVPPSATTAEPGLVVDQEHRKKPAPSTPVLVPEPTKRDNATAPLTPDSTTTKKPGRLWVTPQTESDDEAP